MREKGHTYLASGRLPCKKMGNNCGQTSDYKEVQILQEDEDIYIYIYTIYYINLF